MPWKFNLFPPPPPPRGGDAASMGLPERPGDTALRLKTLGSKRSSWVLLRFARRISAGMLATGEFTTDSEFIYKFIYKHGRPKAKGGVGREGGGYHYVTVSGHSEARECRRTAAQSLHLVSEPEATVPLGLLGEADANPFIAVSVTHAFVFLTDVR